MKLLISALNIFPIKGCAGILTEYLDIRESGPAVRLGGQFVGDRQLMFVGLDGEFKTQRSHPQLSLLLPRVENQNLYVEVAGKSYQVPSEIFNLEERLERTEVKLFGKIYKSPVYKGELTEAVSQFLGEEVLLAYDDGFLQREVMLKNQGLGVHTRWTDSQQFLVVSDESLSDLNKKLSTPLPRDRFRANIWVQGTFPYREDQMTEMFTDDYLLQSTKPCARCKVITVNQSKGLVENKEPLEILSQYRKRDNQVFFGQYFMSTSQGGIIRLGDALQVKMLTS
jgi:uncharacterized protein YcbX